MSACQVLNPLTYQTTLGPNDALQDPNVCNQCKPWKLIVCFWKLSHNYWMPETAVLPQTHLIRYAPITQDTWCVLPEMVALKKSPHPWHRLSLKFGIFICDRNSNTCQKNRAGTNLLNKTKIRQDYYCSSLYICHTKAMITLAEYGPRCLYADTNFYYVLIVRSPSWLKLKSSHFRKCCEENFYLCVRLMQNRREIFSTAAKLLAWRLRVQKAQSPHYWQMGGKNLKSVNHYKYLGGVLNTELSDDKDIQRQLR